MFFLLIGGDTVTLSALLPIGSPVPSGTSIKIDWGAGGNTTTLPITLTAGSAVTFSHTFSSDGHFTATVTISNLASSQVFTVLVSVCILETCTDNFDRFNIVLKCFVEVRKSKLREKP